MLHGFVVQFGGQAETGLHEATEDLTGSIGCDLPFASARDQQAKEAHVRSAFRLRGDSGGHLVEDEPVVRWREEQGGFPSSKAQ